MPRYHYNRGWVRVRLGTSKAAVGDIQEAQLLYQLAITDCNKGVALNPQDPYAYSYRADAKLKFGEFKTLTGKVEQAEQHYRQAIEDCRQAIVLNPKHSSCRLYAGTCKSST